jgi:hypothetical protein
MLSWRWSSKISSGLMTELDKSLKKLHSRAGVVSSSCFNIV